MRALEPRDTWNTASYLAIRKGSSHLSLIAALVSLLKSFLKPMPASKSVKLFCALILRVASRRTWEFWSNLDKLTIDKSWQMKPTSQCHSLACWTWGEPHLAPCHRQSLCPPSHPQLALGWRIALSSVRRSYDKCSLRETFLTVDWMPKSVLRKIPWVSRLLGMSTTTGGVSTMEIILSMEMSTQHTPWKGDVSRIQEKWE